MSGRSVLGTSSCLASTAERRRRCTRGSASSPSRSLQTDSSSSSRPATGCRARRWESAHGSLSSVIVLVPISTEVIAVSAPVAPASVALNRSDNGFRLAGPYTVSPAALLVAKPALFVATQRYCTPFSWFEELKVRVPVRSGTVFRLRSHLRSTRRACTRRCPSMSTAACDCSSGRYPTSGSNTPSSGCMPMNMTSE